MTTLELAEKVAIAVMTRDRQSWGAPPPQYVYDRAQVVLRCLHEHQSWFCRLTLTEDNQQMHADTLEDPYEMVQMELYK